VLAHQWLLLPVLRFEDWLARWSGLFNWARVKMQGSARPGRPPRVDREKYSANLGRMIGLAREQRAKVALIDWNLT